MSQLSRVDLDHVFERLRSGLVPERGLEAFAKDQHWWAGSEHSPRLNVASAFRNRHVPLHISAGRQRRSTELLRAARGRHDVGTFRPFIFPVIYDGARIMARQQTKKEGFH